MAELKTQRSDASVEEFLNSVQAEGKRGDAFALLEMLREVTGQEPTMWGPSIVGFGSYHYRYASGREGDWMLVGFSPRKRNLALYIMDGSDGYQTLLDKLGKYRTGKSCLYINKLQDVDVPTLRQLIAQSVAHVRASNP